MKFILVSGLIALRAFSSTAQTKLQQDFELSTFPPSGWTLEYSGPQYWEHATVGGYGVSSGSTVFRFFDASNFEIQSLVTPSFNATGAGDSLSFDHAYATFNTEVDSLVIEVSGNGGASYTRLIALQGGPTVGVGMVTVAGPRFTSFTPTASEWAAKRYILPIGTNKIRFTAKSAYGNNLYLDNIRVSQPLVNDVGVVGIESPRYFINFPFPSTPKATIRNFGSTNQIFPVTMTISGPSGFAYSSTKTDTLTTGTSHIVTFAPGFQPIAAGTYSVVCYTNLAGDQSKTNDTVRTTVTANNYNYGSNGAAGNQLYYFTNSLPGNGSPAIPQTGWKDTSGSTYLIAGGVAYAPLTGGVDDGFFTLRNLFPGKQFRLFGSLYSDSVFISTNGIISFREGSDAFVPSGIPSGATPNAAIYPFWTDLNFTDPDISGNSLSYKIDGDILIVTYTKAPRYNELTDPDDYLTFQVCLKFSAGTASNSFVSVQFDSAQTGSTFLSAYNAHAFPHLIGMENATGTTAVTYRFVDGGAPVKPGPAFGSSVTVTFGPAYQSFVKLNLKAYLEGGYSTGAHTMRTGANGILPLLQPYSIAPWNFRGAERVSTFPDSVVDWVLVELRNGISATNEIGQRAGLITKNGSIVDVDGVSPMLFNLVGETSGYAIVRHRNHLAIMSASTLPLVGIGSTYDFSSGQSQAYGTLPMTQIESGRFALIAGDANSSGGIDGNDAQVILGATGLFGYRASDVNLSGIVTASDLSLTFSNFTKGTQVP